MQSGSQILEFPSVKDTARQTYGPKLVTPRSPGQRHAR